MTELLNHRYRILQTIGDGGFGQTFLAEDTHLPSNRRCVIKQLKPVARSQLYQLVKERFQREAAILEALGEGSVQIPKLYAYFESEGLFYLVQEWIDGTTLSQRLQQQGPCQEAEVRALLVSLLHVLDYIHQQGIIHRDIKPDNIMLRRSTDQPVLIDFGAVKETVQTVLNSQGQPTQSIIIGTPGYMPQEQAVGKPVFASDLYSLGLTAVYLLTGQSPPQLEVHLQTGEYVWQSRLPQISAGFAAVIDRAIQSHSRDRYTSAREMLLSLQSQALSQTPSPTSPVASTIVPQHVLPSPSPAVPSTVYHSGSPTIATAPQPAVPVSDSGRQSNPILLGSLIAGGLIGASVILGLVLTRPLQQSLSPIEPDVESSPQPSNTVESPNSTATGNSSQSTQGNVPAPNIPTPNIPQPNIPTVAGNANSAAADPFAWLSTRSVTDADLAGKTAFELDVMRNAIYARHGRRFNDEALQTYFNSQSWYQPAYSPEEFPVSLLSDVEKQNAQSILDYQNEKGLK